MEQQASSRADAIAKLAQQRMEGGKKRYYQFDKDVIEKAGPGGKKLEKFSAAVGQNFIRILPPHDPSNYFGLEMYIHRNIGIDQNTFLCLHRMRGDACPVCEIYQAMKQSGQFEGKEGWQELRKFSSLPARWLFFLVDTTSAATVAKGPQYWDAPQQINDNILGLSQNPRSKAVIDISDPRLKIDLSFTRVGQGKHTTYNSYSILEGSDVPPEFLQLPDFKDILYYPTYEEVLKALGRDYKDIIEACNGGVSIRVEESPVSSPPSGCDAPSPVRDRIAERRNVFQENDDTPEPEAVTPTTGLRRRGEEEPIVYEHESARRQVNQVTQDPDLTPESPEDVDHMDTREAVLARLRSRANK